MHRSAQCVQLEHPFRHLLAPPARDLSTPRQQVHELYHSLQLFSGVLSGIAKS
jgi:hypothetical protein